MSNSELLANERSEGGELITEMNLLFSRYDWGMKTAVGELSLKTNSAEDNRNGTLFPDAVIFADKEKIETLMGWEFKMPDVAIDNAELYSNALDKANRMGTQVFVLWNFQNAAVYIKDDSGWPATPTQFFNEYYELLVDRHSVHANSNQWKKQLYDVLAYLNSELIAEKFEAAPIEFNIASYVSTIADKLTPAVANHYMQSSDMLLKSRMRKWRKSEQAELVEVKKDESDSKVADAFARNVIIRWVNRIIFAHLLKTNQNIINDVLVNFAREGDIATFAAGLNVAVEQTDFYTILHVDPFEDDLPQRVTDNLNEFNLYLANTDFSHASEEFVSRLLESVVDVTVRELMGLYTTPVNLAKLLVGVTVQTTDGNFADVTTGSGTIAHAIQNILRANGKSDEFIHDHVWASDRYSYPLQIANLNLTSPDSFNLKNIVFQHNALDLKVGEQISIVDPAVGTKTDLKVPAFDYIISNLPFVGSNDRNEEDQAYIDKVLSRFDDLNDKTDLYQAMILQLQSLLSKNPKARIGVITSNSWTKVQKDYRSFFKTLTTVFDVEMVLQPLRGRWFQNAKVAATILVLKLKGDDTNQNTRFVMVKNGLTAKDGYADKIQELVDDIRLNEPNNLYVQQTVDKKTILSRLNMGMSIEAMFDNVSWLDAFQNRMSPLSKYVEGGRGTKTGGDPIFIMDEQKVDYVYSFPFLKTVKDVSTFEVEHTNNYYFFTRDSFENLTDKKSEKTLKYLKSIQNSETAIKRQKKLGEKWFNAEQAPQYADFITSINPQDRYFWSRVNPDIAVNQRATAFRVKTEFKDDIEVLHAILNSLPSQYMLAASGFGRGQGVTDLTKDGIMQIYVPSLDELSDDDKIKIINAWGSVKNKSVPLVKDQVLDSDWIDFNRTIFDIYGVDFALYNTMASGLVDLLERRVSAKNVVG